MDCLKQDKGACLFIKNFKPLPEIANKLANYIEVFKADDDEVLKNDDEAKATKNLLFKTIDELVNNFTFSNDCKDVIKEFNAKNAKLNPHAQKEATIWLVHSLLLMEKSEPQTVEWVIRSGLWSELGLLRHPNLRNSLTPGLFAFGANEKKNDLAKFIKSTMGHNGLCLLAIPFFELQEQGVTEDLISKYITNLSLLDISGHSPLKSGSSVQNLLEAFYLLSSTNIFTPEKKSSGLAKFFPKSDIKIQEQIVKNASAAKGLLQLKDNEWTESKNNIIPLFGKCFEQLIPLKNFKGNVVAKYEEIFASSRNPTGLITLAAGLKTLNENEVMVCLGQFVQAVFSGTLKELRYDIKNNPHLAKIAEKNPNLLEKWKKDVSVTSEAKVEQIFDPNTWLRARLINEKHLGEVNLLNFEEYLSAVSAESDEMKNGILGKLQEELLSNMKGKKKEEVMKDPYLLNLKLQIECIKLVNAGAVGKIKKLKVNFQELEKILQHENFSKSEFVNDVKVLLESIKKEIDFEKEMEKEKIDESVLLAITSDDPIDLLQSGTDVANSCLRLDGDPNSTKGLLGSLMDGKNRLLAIKDKKGKIVARCMLRLLWDGEQPVLYRETFYPNSATQQQKDLLNKLAIKIAENLEVTLTNNSESGDCPLFCVNDFHHVSKPNLSP